MHDEKCMAFVEDDASAGPHKLSLAAEQDLFAALSAALLENPERLKSDNTDTEPASSWSEANIWTIRPGEVGAKGRQNSAALKKLDDNLGRRGLIILGALVLTLGVGFSGGWASHKYVGVEAHTTGQKQTVLPSVHPEVAVTAVPKTDMLSRAPALRQTSPSLGPATNAFPRFAKIPTVSGSAAKSIERASPSGADTVEPVRLRQPVPETGPTTIEGWLVRDVRGEAIVLQGPDGMRKVARGDMVPGVGRIDSVVRWGSRWIVSTTSGLIATP